MLFEKAEKFWKKPKTNLSRSSYATNIRHPTNYSKLSNFYDSRTLLVRLGFFFANFHLNFIKFSSNSCVELGHPWS